MEEALARYLEPRLGGAVRISGLTRIAGGASRETWMFDAAYRDARGEQVEPFILRKDPPASLVESEREVEYTYYAAFEGSEVPVPRMRWLETDPQHLGAPFFIMDRILTGEGGTAAIQSSRYNATRGKVAERFYEVLGALHRHDWRTTPIAALTPEPAADACWSREVDYWEDMIDRNELSPQPIARAAIRWLRANPPPPAQRITVVHGDYRVGNFLYAESGDVTGIVDWEMAHLGDPLEDLAWSFMEAWEWMRDGRKGGIIEAEDAIRVYERASGIRVDRAALHWWDVFSGVKGQALWLTGAKSFAERRTNELVLPFTAYWLTNFQDEILLRSMGRPA